tara:strand:+ start:607 stop:1308 length:702 start_codon:yes stop_codon:yes gene_type:complete
MTRNINSRKIKNKTRSIENEENSDLFWYEDISILFLSNRLIEFFPTSDMSLNEKLNAITRFSIYLTILLILSRGNYLTIYIVIFTMIITYGLYYVNKKKYYEFYQNENELENEEKECLQPTPDNPFMNVLVSDYKYNPRRRQACRTNRKKTQEKINNNFNTNLYRDVGDVFNRNNSQREFYTMPSTTIPNDQDSFSKWLYKTDETCKEGNGEKCYSNMNAPFLSDTPHRHLYH